MNNTEALTPTLKRLQELLTWEDGWNSYDALAPKPEAVSRATSWITELHQHLTATWIAPNVTATAHGDVVLSWRTEQKKLTIYFDEQDIDYLQVDGKGINAPMYEGNINSLEDMQKLWEWLLEDTKEKQA